MARAAVKAKQQAARAQAQPAKQARRRRSHAGGGNQNQDLFFTRLRRRQKWVFLVLAIVFAITFAAVGVGSGSGGLSQLFSGILGGTGSTNSVSKAQSEIKTNPAKGYRDLANAYIAQGNYTAAITTLQRYLNVKSKDAALWTQLGTLEAQQGDNYVAQYQQAQQTAALADPGSVFQPSGALGQQLGTNPVGQSLGQQAQSQMSQYYQQATTAYSTALNAFQTVAKLQPRSTQAQFNLATAAERAHQYPLAIKALQRYLDLDPHSPNAATIISDCKQLGGTCSVPKKK